MTSNTLAVGSGLTQSMVLRNFNTVQSCSLAVGASSGPVTFTVVPGTQIVSFKVCNKGSTGAYIAAGIGSATAAASTATPAANCDYMPANSTQVFDYPGGTNVFAAIQETTSTNLEISIGYGS